MSAKTLYSRLFSALFATVFLLAQVGPVQANGSGTISGTLMDADGNPITGVAIQVRAVLKPSEDEVAATTSNPADGTYSLTGLPLDTELAVVASDEEPDTDGYDGEYYDNTIDVNWAETIMLSTGSENRTGVDFKLSAGEYATIEQLILNVRTGRLLEDVQLRKAIAYGTNKQALLESAFEPNGSTGELVYMPIPPQAWFLADPADVTIYNYNKTEAETILTNAGWTDTDEDNIRENASNEELALDFITTTATARVMSANLFKDQMAEIGIKVNVYTYPAGEFFNDDPDISPLTAGNFDIAEFAWGYSSLDSLISVYQTGDGGNHGGFSSTALDTHYNNARDAKTDGSIVDFEENALLWQQTFADELPSLPLFTRTALPPPPTFAVRANSDEMEGWGWVNGTTVTIEIDHDGDTVADIIRTADVIIAPWDSNQTWFYYNFQGEFDIQPGDVVTVTEGAITKTHTVTNVEITNIDMDTEVVHGTADPDTNVDVWACNDVLCANRHVITNGTGQWQADFSTAGAQSDEQDTYNFDPGTWADCGQPDSDGDTTQFWKGIPNPIVGVRPNGDVVEGWGGWVDGTTVTIKIDSDDAGTTPDITKTAVVGPAPWNPDDIRFEYNFSGEYDIKPGDTVTVTDGTLTKTLLVSIHQITGYDLDTDMVYGASDPSARVDVWSCDEHGCYNRHLTADEITGEWSADFANPGTEDDEQDIVDLVRGTWIDSSQPDEDGDQTMHGFSIPNPRFGVRPSDNYVEGWDWNLGTEVTIEIDEDHDGNPEASQTVTVGPAPWNPNETHFEYNFSGNFDIQPGHKVTVSDGVTTKELVVSTHAITGYDLDADLVYGKSTPGSRVDIWVCDDHNCYNRHLTADETTGDWTADYANPGTQGDEQDLFDIAPEIWMDSNEFDEDGDVTYFGMHIPNPHIEASLQNNWISAREWAKDAEVTLEIDDASNGLGGIDYTTTAIMEQAPWNPGDPNDIVGLFDLDTFTLGAGDVITVYGDMNGGTITKELTVTTFKVTTFNLVANTITGTAASNAYVEACVNIPNDCFHRDTTASGTGAWTVNFSPDHDLVSGDNGWAAEYDADSDRMWYDWNVNQTTFKSVGSADGWILESAETSNKGGTLNKGASTFNVGDDAANKQYRSVLSFGTAGLPDNAVITKVTLQVKQQGIVGGGKPVTLFGGFVVDIKKGNFGKPTLQLTDFNAKPTKSFGAFKPSLTKGWYTINLTNGKAQINLTGNTQIRLRFKKDDNNNFIANFLKLYSGNAPTASRPQLIVEYYVP